jgi:hypothetical protein
MKNSIIVHKETQEHPEAVEFPTSALHPDIRQKLVEHGGQLSPTVMVHTGTWWLFVYFGGSRFDVPILI